MSSQTAGGNYVQATIIGQAPGWTAANMCGGGTKTCPNRWADGDTGNGVSGSAYAQNTLKASQGIINQNASPIGGPSTCPWTQNKCGPNDEPFSLQIGGCHALLADSSVRFISQNIDTDTIRKLCDRSDGGVVGVFLTSVKKKLEF